MFACALGCVMAAARVLLLMAHHGLAHKSFSVTDARQETPSSAGVLAALLAFVPVAILVQGGAKADDLYGWLGTLAVFGFMTAYGLVAVALPVHLAKVGRTRAATCWPWWPVGRTRGGRRDHLPLAGGTVPLPAVDLPGLHGVGHRMVVGDGARQGRPDRLTVYEPTSARSGEMRHPDTLPSSGCPISNSSIV